MNFILLSAAVLAAVTMQARAYQCTPGTRYCGDRFIGQSTPYNYYWGASVQAAHEHGTPDYKAPYSLFECDTNISYLRFIEDCGSGNCITPGGTNNDYCI